ncbi:MAG: hypothetical protein GWN84_01785 [Gammaproteobacteria bacterium]|nr:hypothetical protein [Gammaproteobacteria bacterium]NIR81892.1 hypothetical protein [Gammaproteobacteria bacterium]NIR88724.1 hypothetical protein [Gammaproteobacteria bacterium]NIU03000.1 hypothetical protein [Gammaproteobacteria bacterium]NIV50521.1 hypothetical protein [Gammaproteobacteria bacterium]
MGTLGEIEWGELRGALALLIATLLVSTGLLGGSHYFESRMEMKYEAQKRRLSVVRSNYYTVDEEERLIEAYLPKYRALREQGIIGDEQRLSWVEALGDASASIELPSLTYEISPRRPFVPDIPLETGAFQVYASEMNLRIGLLHEGDLPALLRALDRNATGLYSVSYCRLSRNVDTFRLAPMAENLTAQCTLRWYTIALPEGEKVST